MNLQTKMEDAGRVYKMFAKRLEKLGIFTMEDFLYHLPFRYEDFSLVSKIGGLQAGETVTVQAKVISIKSSYLKSRKTLQKALVEDDTGRLEVTWFNQPFLTKSLSEEDTVSLSGSVHRFGNKITMQTPDYEILGKDGQTIHTARLVPVYHETQGITSKWLRRQTSKLLLEHRNAFEEFLPEEIIQENNFLHFPEALQQAHFPDSVELAVKARERLAFNELLMLQLSALSRKQQWEEKLHGHPFFVDEYKKELERFYEQLPFELTGAQRKAINDIYVDLATPRPMNRLLEGDVGSGKTVVAGVAMYLAFLNGFQSILMAPTEILAQQHYQTLFKLLFPLGVKVAVATGSKKQNIDNFDILIGTHAVLNDRIDYEKVGLVVIDEQQRFGVEQRALLRKKGTSPHVLTMTATPIPRTVALTMYGDLDLSYLDEMPKGRKEIKTWLVPPQKRQGAYVWMEELMRTTDSQAFVICPFIEESENMQTVKAATVEFERLQKEVFPNLKLGLLHGKMKGKEKDEMLQRFKNREFDILVATPVVEVGIDIPNATIMLIEASDRFGLSQLHQLRGRVGRGDKQSYCLLFTESKSIDTFNRLKSLEKIHFGPELAELDLKLRGAGDVYGTRQHGLPNLKVATFSDSALIVKAKHTAEKLYPVLEHNEQLKKRVTSTLKEVSPD